MEQYDMIELASLREAEGVGEVGGVFIISGF